MRILTCGLLLFAAAHALATDPDYVRKLHPLPELTPARLEAALHRIDRYTQDHLASQHTPGLWITVVKDGKVVWLKGYGYQNLEKKTPMTPDTMTMIASCSKAFTSTLVLMGVQDGKVDLNAPVRQYLPYFHLKAADADSGMTVADLMCHSSGLPRTDAAWITDALDERACLDVIANAEPTFNFRENAQYSNILVGDRGNGHRGRLPRVYSRPAEAEDLRSAADVVHVDHSSRDLRSKANGDRLLVQPVDPVDRA